MAKKKTKPANTVPKPEPARVAQSKPASQPTKTEEDFFQKRATVFIMGGIVALATWLFYRVCLENQFTNWDDPSYIINNGLIKDTSGEGLKAIFSEAVMGNYHPFTILSYAIEYSYVNLQPWLYHFDSLLLHVVVTVLVYCFVNLLTRRPLAAAITALLFGLHPMHVESVAWLAGRKDVLYATFYVAACIVYIYYLRTAGGKKWLWYFLVLVLFLCSLLSKPVAVVLPLTLLIIDYFERRKFMLATILEKLPHFAIAVGFGIKSIMDQKSFGSVDTHVTSNLLDRLALGGYAFITYLWKAVAPIGLCNYYPYPGKTGALPATFYIYPVAMVAMIFLVWRFARKSKPIVFGTLFFMANIILLLQFLPVGSAIIAERYTYMSYLGLFFIVGWFVSEFFEKGGNRQIGYAALTILMACSMWLGYLSNERCKAWYDAISLWRDEIEKQPTTYNAYNNLGFEYFNKFNTSVDNNQRKIYFDSSLQLLNRSVELNPSFANSYISLGELMRCSGNLPQAKAMYYKALSLKTSDKDPEAYQGLGIVYAMSGNLDSCGYSFRRALELRPKFPEAHSNYGNYFDMMRMPDSALAHYAIALKLDPDRYDVYINRGRLLQRMNRCNDAMKDFEQAIKLNPNNGEVYYARSHCYQMAGNKAGALQDVEKAISLGFRKIDRSYYETLKTR